MTSSARIDELLKKFEENPRRYFAPLANEYRKAGDVERAIELCREHLPQQPGHMSGHIVFGQALFESGKLEEAKGVFEAALALDPENLIALRHLGDIARNDGDLAGARAWYQRVLDADPRNEEIATQLASLDEAGTGGEVTARRGPSDATAAPAVATAATSEVSARTNAAFLGEDRRERRAELETAPPPRAASPEPEIRPLDAAPAAGEEARQSLADPFDLGALGNGGAIERTPAHGADSLLGGPASPVPALEGFELARDDAAELRVAAERLELQAAQPASAAPAPEPAQPVRPAPAPAPEPAKPAAAAPPPPPTRAPEPGPALGLETMEFVPPSREEQVDPVAGRLLRDEAPASATPSAFVTETMAELYLQQGFHEEALSVYRQLLEQNPNDQNLRERVAQLEGGSVSSVSAAGISDTVIEAARQRRSAPGPLRTARSFFASLAILRPGASRGETAAGDDATSDDAAAPRERDGSAFDDFGFPGGDDRAAASRALPYDTSDDEPFADVDSAAAARERNDERAAELPPDAAIEPATLDYAADNEAARSGAGDDATLPDGFDVVPAEEMTGDRYGATEDPTAESAEAPDEGTRPAATTGPVELLFGGAGIGREDDAAASALANAYSAPPILDEEPGDAGASRPQAGSATNGAPPSTTPATAATPRATRPAASELSLDHVFRDTPRRTTGQRRESPAFSFDQFFSETANGGAGGRGAGEQRSSSTPAEGSAADADAVDIEQFNAWLEGLKKK